MDRTETNEMIKRLAEFAIAEYPKLRCKIYNSAFDLVVLFQTEKKYCAERLKKQGFSDVAFVILRSAIERMLLQEAKEDNEK